MLLANVQSGKYGLRNLTHHSDYNACQEPTTYGGCAITNCKQVCVVTSTNKYIYRR